MDVRLLGPFDVIDDEGQAIRLGGPKQRGILAILLVQPNTLVTSESLVRGVWGDAPPPSALGLVRTYVSRLRSVLDRSACTLVGSRRGYAVEVEPEAIDARRFERQVEQARAAAEAGDHERALRLVDVALDSWRGAPLADLADLAFVAPIAARLEQRRAVAYEMRMDARIALGRNGDAIGDLETLTAQYPLHERFWALLMTALYRVGRQADALAAYQTVRAMLIEQLGVEPGPELRALEQDVLHQAHSLQWAGGRDDASRTSIPRDLLVGHDGPIQVGCPPARASAFQARPEVDASTAPHRWDASTQPRPTFLIGGGGVGKTQSAAAAFARARADGTDVLVWVDASTRESIQATYAQAYVDVLGGSPTTPADRAAQSFLSALGVTTNRWLVVLDDVTDPADLRDLLPDGAAGHVLGTSRRRDLTVGDAQQVLVDAFTAAEAHAYLEARLSGAAALPARPDALTGAAELAADLGRLPVGLAQAAAVILNEAITCAEYRDRLTDQASGIDQLFPTDAAADGYASTVGATWTLAIEQADRLEPAGAADPALRIAAVLDPNGAPGELWRTRVVSAFVGASLGGDRGASAQGPRAALRNLHRLSLVEHDVTDEVVRTHALVQRAVLDGMDDDDRAHVVVTAADALAEVWQRYGVAPDQTRFLRQNVAALARRRPEALWTDRPHRVLLWAGYSLEKLGLLDEASAYWAGMAATAGRLLGAEHPETMAIQHHHADCLGEAGDASGAARLLADLLEERRLTLGPHHPDTLATHHGLIWWVGSRGDARAAVVALRDLLAITNEALGEAHALALAARNHLAYWTGQAGDPAGAAKLTEALAVDREEALGPHHPDTLATQHGLAWWSGTAGDPGGAAALLRGLLDTTSEVAGPRHPHTLATANHLAYWTGKAGEPAEAARILTELLEDREQALGPNAPDTLATRHHLAHWIGQGGDIDEAIHTLARLVDDRAHLLGATHPHTLVARAHLRCWHAVAAGGPAAANARAELQRTSDQPLASDSNSVAARIGKANSQLGRRWTWPDT